MNILRRTFLAASLALPLLSVPALAEPVTLDFWAAWDPSQPDGKAAQQKIAEFGKANPDIKVNVQVIAFDAMHDKLVTAVSGGDAPDVSWGLAEWFGQLNRMGALADLSADAANWPDRAAIYPNALESLSVNGKLMALPNYLGIRALLYHADMLKAAGVAEPPKSWGELVAASKKIRDATGKPGFGIAGRGVRSPQELIMYLAQNDVEIAKRMADGKYRNDWADDPEAMRRAAEVFAFYRKMMDEGTIPEQSAGWGWEEEDTNFALGQYAMVVNGSWIRGRVEQNPQEMKDVLVAAPPAGRKAATFFEVAPLYVFKSEHPQEAWKLASFMLSKDFQSAVFPDRSPGSDTVGDKVWGQSFTALMPTGVAFPPVALGAITRDMEESIGRVLLKGEDPAAVAERLGKDTNKALRQSGEISTQ